MHNGERKTRFCKEPTCWERLCPNCAEDRHSGHNVVSYLSLLSEMRTAKEKYITENGRLLMEYKKLLIDLEHFHKKFVEKDGKLVAKEKKLRVSLEEKLKSLRNTILTQRERTKKKIDSVMEDISASKVILTQNVLELERMMDKILSDGQNTDIREFFQKCQKPPLVDPEKYREMVDLAAKELDTLNKIDQSISFRELPLMGYTRRGSPRPEEASPSKKVAPAKEKKQESAEHRSISQGAQGSILRQTKSLVSKLTALGLKKNSKASKNNVEGELVSMRSGLEKLTYQVNQKKGMLDMLNASIATTREHIATLEGKRDQLLKTNNAIKLSIEKQNKLFANAVNMIVVPSSRGRNVGSRKRQDLNRTAVLDSSGNDLGREETKDLAKITLLLKQLLKKHSHGFTAREESLTAEEIIGLLDSMWPKPARAESKPRISQDSAKKDTQVMREKRALEMRLEALQSELR